jgi:hypothetical protein
VSSEMHGCLRWCMPVQPDLVKNASAVYRSNVRNLSDWRYNLHAFIISSSGVVKILHWNTRSIMDSSLVHWGNGLHESVSSSRPKSWLRYFCHVSNHGKLRYGRVSVCC